MRRIKPSHSILLVEDSDEDFETARRAFAKAKLANPIIRCSDGDEALDFLFERRNAMDQTNAPLPALILLDLNLPGTDGREVLAQIKADDQLKSIPVVVLTTSSDERDIADCYRSGANSYIQKPVDFHGFIVAIQRLKEFWFEVAILPRTEQQK